MQNAVNHQIRLAARPVGRPKDSDWDLVETPVPDPGAGQVLTKIHYISVDPAMRGWMNDAPSYVPPVEIGAVMRALTVGEVVASNHPEFSVGDHVSGIEGVQEFSLSDGSGLTKVDVQIAPLQTYLSTFGIAGLTAYCGLIEVGLPREGNTVLVSGAAGSVGAHVGQIARIKGCRAVGIAGGAEKCRYLTDELGFDAAIDYKEEEIKDGLGRTCPDGVDIFFDNVGGPTLDAVLTRINFGARVVICGAISSYNDTAPGEGIRNYRALLVRSARMEGFIYFNYRKRWPDMVKQLAAWRDDGLIKCREDIDERGVKAFPEVLLRLFDGANLGKQMIKV